MGSEVELGPGGAIPAPEYAGGGGRAGLIYHCGPVCPGHVQSAVSSLPSPETDAASSQQPIPVQWGVSGVPTTCVIKLTSQSGVDT